MKKLNFFALALTLVTFTGCGDPRIDGTSNESMKESVQNIRESLPEPKRNEFDEAMQVLALDRLSLEDLITEGFAGADMIEDRIRRSLDGKTAEEVIEEAERIRSEREEKEKQQVLEEIRELEQKRTDAESARAQLKKFRVIRSRFYLRKREFFGKEPIIELTVENGTDLAVSRAYFEGTLASPNRSVSWHRDEFNYSIPGGLEPGEKATWYLAPNMFSDWGTVDAPADAVFTVTVEQLDGPDGKALYTTRGFSQHDRERLRELKKTYGVE